MRCSRPPSDRAETHIDTVLLLQGLGGRGTAPRPRPRHNRIKGKPRPVKAGASPLNSYSMTFLPKCFSCLRFQGLHPLFIVCVAHRKYSIRLRFRLFSGSLYPPKINTICILFLASLAAQGLDGILAIFTSFFRNLIYFLVLYNGHFPQILQPFSA